MDHIKAQILNKIKKKKNYIAAFLIYVQYLKKKREKQIYLKNKWAIVKFFKNAIANI